MTSLSVGALGQQLRSSHGSSLVPLDPFPAQHLVEGASFSSGVGVSVMFKDQTQGPTHSGKHSAAEL